MILQDLHCHTTFCDGHDTAEDMVLSAIEKGMKVLGFSGHSYTPFDEEACMSIQGTEDYRTEILRLRKKYKDRIDIYCGIEQDIFGQMPLEPFDYSIGSVHYVFLNGEYIIVDFYPELMKEAVESRFGGDWYSLCELYYSYVSKLWVRTRCDIVGHFDLITKYNEGNCLFDTGHPRYIKAWQTAADELLKHGLIFEINTGAVSRGYRSEPYPSMEIIRYINDKGGKFILSSDSHEKKNLLYGFEDVSKVLEAEGIQLCSAEDVINNK